MPISLLSLFGLIEKISKSISYLITCTKGSESKEGQNQVKQYFGFYPFVEEVQFDNGTVVSEVRYKDVFLEKLVSQLLKDYLAKIDLGENTTAQISQSDPCTHHSKMLKDGWANIHFQFFF